MSLYNNCQSKLSILGRNTILAMNTSFYQFYIFGRLQHPWFYTNISRTVSCLVKLSQNWDSNRFSSVHCCQAVYRHQSLCTKQNCSFLSSASTILVFQKYRIDLLQIIFFVDQFILWNITTMACFWTTKRTFNLKRQSVSLCYKLWPKHHHQTSLKGIYFNFTSKARWWHCTVLNYCTSKMVVL